MFATLIIFFVSFLLVTFCISQYFGRDGLCQLLFRESRTRYDSWLFLLLPCISLALYAGSRIKYFPMYWFVGGFCMAVGILMIGYSILVLWWHDVDIPIAMLFAIYVLVAAGLKLGIMGRLEYGMPW